MSREQIKEIVELVPIGISYEMAVDYDSNPNLFSIDFLDGETMMILNDGYQNEKEMVYNNFQDFKKAIEEYVNVR